MSIKLMTMVWDLDLPHDQQLILLALADHADDDGYHCYPSVAYIGWKCGYSERAVQRILRKLETAELITVRRYRKGGRGHATEYRVQPWKGVKKPPFIREEKGDELTPIEEERVSSMTQRMSSTPERVTHRPPQPSVNHQEPRENVSSPISRNMALVALWQTALDRVTLSPTIQQQVHTMEPRTWTAGVLTLQAPAYLARRRALAHELLRLLAPAAPVELREVRIVNGQ
jgi:hypothetical protein